MDYTKLTYFYTVAKHGHVTRAAEELHLAQPALTKAIHGLEEEIGVKLWMKKGRGIALTEAGLYLKERLDRIIPEMEHLEQDMARFSTHHQKRVRINLLSASGLVTESVLAYGQSHPGTEFQLIQNEKDETSHITVNTCLPQALNHQNQANFRAIRESIYLAVPAQSHLASLATIDLASVREEAFVSLAGSRSFRAICDRICADAGFAPRVAFESDSYTTVQNLVAGRLGICFWPAFTWGSAPKPGISLIPISSPSPVRLITVTLHTERDPGESARNFFGFLTEFLLEKEKAAKFSNTP